MPKPWRGPKGSRVLRTRRSSVPCKTSAFGCGICVPPDDQQEVLRTQIPRSPVGNQQECVTPVEGPQERFVAQFCTLQLLVVIFPPCAVCVAVLRAKP